MAEESYPEELRYHPEHDWARIEGDEATFGITWYAQDALGEVVFYEPPEVGSQATQGRGLRRGRVGEGRLRRLRAPLRRDHRRQRGGRREARADQRGPLRRGLAGPRQALRPLRGRRSCWTPRPTGSCSPRTSSRLALAERPLASEPHPRQSTRLTRYTSATDADRRGDARRDRRRARSTSCSPRSRPTLRLDRAARPAAGPLGDRVLRPPGGARGAQRPRRRRALLPRRGDVRPLRAGDRRRDHPALGVPHPVHALPAGGLAGRPPGDVRVPDRDLGAQRAAGRQRLALRGALVGGLGRLPGDRRDRAPARSSSRAASIPTAARRSAPTRAASAPRWSRSASTAGSPTPPRSPTRSTPTPPPCSSRTRTSSARSRTSRRSPRRRRRRAR